jgi:hypothetical protein
MGLLYLYVYACDMERQIYLYLFTGVFYGKKLKKKDRDFGKTANITNKVQ